MQITEDTSGLSSEPRPQPYMFKAGDPPVVQIIFIKITMPLVQEVGDLGNHTEQVDLGPPIPQQSLSYQPKNWNKLLITKTNYTSANI